MQYLQWAVLALATYTMVPPLMKVGTREIPADVAVLVSNTVLVLGVFGLVAVSEERVSPYLTDDSMLYVYAAGLFVTVGITAYYRALATGPVSVVTPIFGLFMVTSSAIGVVFLDETFTARKALGVAFALVALVLIAGE